MQKVSRKDIQVAVKSIIDQALTKYEISSPSSKTKKLTKELSNKISTRIKTELKKKLKLEKKVKAAEVKKAEKTKKISNAA